MLPTPLPLRAPHGARPSPSAAAYRFARQFGLFGAAALVALAAAATGYSAGKIEITHPYATPSLPGMKSGVAYIATVENKGTLPDRLLRVGTPVAAMVEMHDMSVDAGGVMRMREVAEIALAPKSMLKMRPGQGLHFMLMELKAPLKKGDTFPMTLEFERGGKVEVKVVVQVPEERPGAAAVHKH